MPRRIARVAGSTWIGVGLIGAIFVYLCAVSVFTDDFRRLLGTTEAGLYSHPILLTLAALMLVSLAVATVVRVPRRWPHAGAWCSHLGVGVLAAGSIWYGCAKVGGHTATFWTPAGWTPIRDLYPKDSYVVSVRADASGEAVQNVLPVDPATIDEVQPMRVPLAGAGDGADLHVIEYCPRVRIADEAWRNDLPVEAPAVTIELGRGHNAAEITLCQGARPKSFLRMGDYLLYYHADPPPPVLARLRALAAAAKAKDRAFTPVVISGAAGPLKCPVLGPDGPTWEHAMPGGPLLSVPLARRHLALRLMRTLSHAVRHYRIERVTDKTKQDSRSIIPGVLVSVPGAGGARTVWLPYDECNVFLDPAVVELASGRKIQLKFSRVRVPLPGTVEMHTAKYLTHPGTRIPKDYRSKVTIMSGGSARSEVLCLNNPVMVGPLQLIQSNWQFLPGGTEASHIFLEVRNRPGLWLIWAGCILICAGFPYAFYVKPLLRRRRRAGQ